VRERKILRGALEELAFSDYGGLTIEAVAERCGVNKTTIYRKWPDKAALIRAAVLSTIEMFPVGPTAGDLRSDLRRIARMGLRFIGSAEGRSLMRLRLLRHPEPELAKIAAELNGRQLAAVCALFDAAAQRGEIAPDVNGELLLDMLWGAIHTRAVMKSEAVSARVLEELVDLLVRAAQNPH